MDNNDRQAIDGLFGKLSQVERTTAQRDGDAEAFINERLRAQPAAPYFMAQTIVVQEQALNSAQQRIEELEHQLASKPAGGGLLSSLFGSSAPSRAPVAPRQPMQQMPGQQPSQASGPWGQQAPAFGQQQRGGGFLAGAAQTAMGVAGGVLLGNAIAGMFSGNEAQAAEQPAEQPAEEEPQDDGGMDDMEF